MAEHLIVVNAVAGAAHDDALAPAIDVLRASGPTEVARCEHVVDLDRAIADLRGRTLVVAGGDGSLHLAVEKLRLAGQRPRVGLLPLGTGNDLARTVGVPVDDPVAAAEQVVDGRDHVYDLLVDDAGSICVNALHAGVGATAAARAEALKGPLDEAAYPVGAMLAGLTDGGAEARVSVDGRVVVEDRILLVAVCNGRSFGGGTIAAPDADPTDGLLDVVVSTATGPVARAGFGLALERGDHAGRDDVVAARGTEVLIEGDGLRYDVDGELADAPEARRSWRVEPGAWVLVH